MIILSLLKNNDNRHDNIIEKWLFSLYYIILRYYFHCILISSVPDFPFCDSLSESSVNYTSFYMIVTNSPEKRSIYTNIYYIWEASMFPEGGPFSAIHRMCTVSLKGEVINFLLRQSFSFSISVVRFRVFDELEKRASVKRVAQCGEFSRANFCPRPDQLERKDW